MDGLSQDKGGRVLTVPVEDKMSNWIPIKPITLIEPPEPFTVYVKGTGQVLEFFNEALAREWLDENLKKLIG